MIALNEQRDLVVFDLTVKDRKKLLNLRLLLLQKYIKMENLLKTQREFSIEQKYLQEINSHQIMELACIITTLLQDAPLLPFLYPNLPDTVLHALAIEIDINTLGYLYEYGSPTEETVKLLQALQLNVYDIISLGCNVNVDYYARICLEKLNQNDIFAQFYSAYKEADMNGKIFQYSFKK